MKRSLSGNNYSSLLRPLLQQPPVSTGLEDRPSPPPAPTQHQHHQKRGGLFTRLNSSHPLQNILSPDTSSTVRLRKFETGEKHRNGRRDEREEVEENKLINNCQKSDEREKHILTQSLAAHKATICLNGGSNIPSAATAGLNGGSSLSSATAGGGPQQRLHQIQQQSCELASTNSSPSATVSYIKIFRKRDDIC